MDKLTEAYLSVYESSHLETDMKKRAKDNEKAREDIKNTKAHQEMAKTAAKKFDEGYEELPVDKMVARAKELTKRPRNPGEPRWTKNDQRASDIRKTAGTHSRAKVKKIEKANRERGNQQEQIDLYDVVLEYLMNEGYVDTEENAVTIMANMSEEWRTYVLDEAVLGARKGTIRSVIEKGGKSIKYVQSGGDIVTGDRAAQERASSTAQKRNERNRANAARFQQAAKKSIQTLNANPGEDHGNYGNTDDDHSDGKHHYKLKHTNRADRNRRAKG